MNRAPEPSEKIDAALRLLAGAQPSPQLQSKVLATLAAERQPAASGFLASFRAPKLAFAVATAVLASAVIVAGSVEHSRRITLPTAAVRIAPGGNGLSTASAAHIATQPVKAPRAGRTRHRTARGRASISKHIRKPAGVAVPDAPGAQR